MINAVRIIVVAVAVAIAGGSWFLAEAGRTPYIAGLNSSRAEPKLHTAKHLVSLNTRRASRRTSSGRNSGSVRAGSFGNRRTGSGGRRVK